MICVEGIFASQAICSDFIGEVMPLGGYFVHSDYLPPDGRLLLIFFFPAEYGIRARTVTGVQTCALPISRSGRSACSSPSCTSWMRQAGASRSRSRSEERRVGKECRSRWWPGP